MNILLTGGAGFVGSNLAKAFRKDHPNAKIVCLDNLKRRGSEFNLATFKNLKIDFVHGDVRNASDLESLDADFDIMIEASAEPSVLAGLNGSPHYLLDTNLAGTLNCLTFARTRVQKIIFLSTSRVYSIEPLKQIQLIEKSTRLEISSDQKIPGVSQKGISETFPVHLPRSLYGATKLASEYMIQEYVYAFNMKAIINRCGVLAGPGQFGKTDQGVFTLWIAHHYFKKKLQYTGFGGTGKQVRDLLHPLDLYDLIQKQIPLVEKYNGGVFNVGGGQPNSISLQEFTQICEKITGNSIQIDSNPSTSTVDIPTFVTDSSVAHQVFTWKPKHSVENIVDDTYQWICENEHMLKPLFN
jgi:CDP-paratose 2-epimerase